MGAKLSAKQREFLEAVEHATKPVSIDYSDNLESIPCYLKYGFYWDWNFRSEADADRWIKNLEQRKLIAVKDRSFVTLTDAGRTAIAKDKQP